MTKSIKIIVFLMALAAYSTTAWADRYICSKTDLIKFAHDSSTNSFEGETIYLTCDITLTLDWSPIGKASSPFKGRFEGWGHTISGLTINNDNYYQGLFGYIDGGSVSDVKVIGSIKNCRNYVGGICGYLKRGEIKGCYNEATVSGVSYVGGICGYTEGIITSCINTGNITSTKTTGGEEIFIGGIVGYATNENASCYVRHCYTTGVVTIPSNTFSYYGAIAGWINIEDIIFKCVYDSDKAKIHFADTDTDLEDESIAIGGDKNNGPSNNYWVFGATTTVMKTKSFWTDGKLLSDYVAPDVTGQLWVYPESQNADVLTDYPQLRAFDAKNKPITFEFTSEKPWKTIVPNGNYSVPAGMTAYKVASVDAASGTVTLHAVSNLYEGRGYLVYGTSTVTATSNSDTTDYTEEWLLKGSPTSHEVLMGDGTEYILSDGAFWRAKSGSLGYGKAYLKLSNALTARTLSIGFDTDETTAIQQIDQHKPTDAVRYDLNGRRATEATHGIIIENGKKILKR